MRAVWPQDLLDEFVAEARERLDEVETALLDLRSGRAEGRADSIAIVRRGLHTLKGNSAMMGFAELRDLAHRLEDEVEALAALAPGAPAEVAPLLSQLDRCRALVDLAEADGERAPAGAPEGEVAASSRTPGSLRVPFAALDALVDQLAEMVILRNRLRELVHLGRQQALVGAGNRGNWEEAERAEQALARGLQQLQERIMELRMVPLRTLFPPLRRIAHDEGARWGKQVELDIQGGDTPMDKALLELANEALGHLVRNAVIHGIEAPGERIAAGKPPVGRVGLTAEARSGEVWIAVTDDGAGIDRQRLAEEAVARGLPVGAADRSFDLLFLPGFTTQRGASLSAGRGIGLAAVKEAVRRQAGRIDVESRPGVGTRFELRLPLAVSITRSLIVESDRELYALPLAAVVESVRFDAQASHRIDGAGIFKWRGAVVPVLDLGASFGTAEPEVERSFLVMIELDGEARGLAVDGLVGIQEIVVRALDPIVGQPPGILGSTILGDGRAILILDPRSLMNLDPRQGRSA